MHLEKGLYLRLVMRFDFFDDDMRRVLRAPPFFLRGTGTAPAVVAACTTLNAANLAFLANLANVPGPLETLFIADPLIFSS